MGAISVCFTTQQNRHLRDVLQTMTVKVIEVLALSEVRWPGHGVSQLEDTIVAYSDMVDSNLTIAAESSCIYS